jgi:4-hydroxy-3-methylbut-2-enyl diphosphate reductase
MDIEKQTLKIILASPRGFCAGVDRAVQMVNLALKKYGAPVYVRHEIVHNRYVVDSLKERGAVFVEELSEIPDEGRPVIFSAHGVPKSVPEEAECREMFYIDATCPLVSKVHREARRHHEEGRFVILIGHKDHPEVIGTMGQLPEGAAVLIETEEDVEYLQINDPDNLAWSSQTTLSVDETSRIVRALEKKFPLIEGPISEDICYATTNRQQAVKALAPLVDAFIVIGAPNSSNSARLVEVAKKSGCSKAMLVQRASDIEWDWLDGSKILALTAGASAPETLVEEVIGTAKKHFDVTVEEKCIVEEDVVFQIPKNLREAAS